MVKRQTIADQLRQAVTSDPRGVHKLAQDAGVAYPVLWRFMHKQRGLNLDTADRICLAIGADLHIGKQGNGV